MEKHNHYIFLGYDESKKLENGTTIMEFAVKIEVQDAPSEEVGLTRAKQLVKRKNYYLEKTFECSACSDDDDKSRHEAIQMTQLKLMTKALQGHR